MIKLCRISLILILRSVLTYLHSKFHHSNWNWNDAGNYFFLHNILYISKKYGTVYYIPVSPIIIFSTCYVITSNSLSCEYFSRSNITARRCGDGLIVYLLPPYTEGVVTGERTHRKLCCRLEEAYTSFPVVSG